MKLGNKVNRRNQNIEALDYWSRDAGYSDLFPFIQFNERRGVLGQV